MDPSTLLIVTAMTVAFAGLLLAVAHGSPADKRIMRRWGSALLTGAAGLAMYALDEFLREPATEVLGTILFLAATGQSWTAARLFAGRAVRWWWPGIVPAAWVAAVLFLAPDLRLATACWAGTAATTLAAVELRRSRAERLPSLPTIIVLLGVHASVYALRGLLACIGMPAAWLPVAFDVLVGESLLHALGTSFLILAMMKERMELRSSEELRGLALSDALTGIANRRHFDIKFGFEVDRLASLRQPLSLVLFDVDHFKRYNDVRGHPAGDRCLRAVAAAIGAGFGQVACLVARYGGEEFAVLLPRVGFESAVGMAEAGRAAVARLSLSHPAGGIVTVSAGVAAIQGPADPGEWGPALLDAADQALYRAKAMGRNRVCMAGGETTEPVPAVTAAMVA